MKNTREREEGGGNCQVKGKSQNELRNIVTPLTHTAGGELKCTEAKQTTGFSHAVLLLLLRTGFKRVIRKCTLKYSPPNRQCQ